MADGIVNAMAKHRELSSVVYASTLGSSSASKIWRTVVFSGAMLAAPLVIGCGGGNKKTDTTQQDKAASDKAAADQAAADKAASDKAAADKAAAEKAAADKAAADKAASDQAAADQAAADKTAADQAAADKQAADDAAQQSKRPRGGNERPSGRGFILS